MKKGIIAAVLILIGAGMAFGQGWEFWGELATGLRIETFSGGEDWYGPDYQWKAVNEKVPEGQWQWENMGRRPYDASISMFNWFMGSYFEFSARYTRGNYGIKSTLWLNFFNKYERLNEDGTITTINIPLEIWSIYGWLDLYYDQIRLTLGRMHHTSDKIWIAPGVWDADHNYSTGDGLRVEYKPAIVQGLNVGLALFIPDVEVQKVWPYGAANMFSGQRESVYKETTNPSGWMGDSKNSKLVDFLLNTGFGLQYESEKFNMAAGFKLDSKADMPSDSDWGETYFAFGIWQLWGGPEGAFNKANLLSDFPWRGYDVVFARDYWDGKKNTIELMSGGMQGYIGFDLNMFGPFRFKAGVRAYNLGCFDEYGWLWINQELTFTTMEPMVATFGLDLHQRILVMDNVKREFALVYEDENHTKPSDKKPVLFTIIPRWDAFLTKFCYVGLNVPIKFWPGIVNIDLTVKPKIGYMFGDGLFGKTCYIELEYWFNYIVFSKYGNLFSEAGNGSGNAAAPYRDSDPLIRNTIQLQFKIVY
jgi:hypothetical protein